MSDADRWELPLTTPQIEELKNIFRSHLNHDGSNYELSDCTCYDCPKQFNNTCVLQWDPYNTHGDCLLSK